MPEARQDIQQLRASQPLRRLMNEMRANGDVSELVDGYRLCIAMAIAYGRRPDPERDWPDRQTRFQPNTVDTDESALRIAVSEMFPEVAHVPYRALEDLAEQGAEIVKGLMRDSALSFSDLLDAAERAADSEGAVAPPQAAAEDSGAGDAVAGEEAADGV